MAEDTVRQECDERTGEYRENEAGEDRDPLHQHPFALRFVPAELHIVLYPQLYPQLKKPVGGLGRSTLIT